MSKRKIKETLGYDPLSNMLVSESTLIVENKDSAETPSHDVSFVQFIDDLLDPEKTKADTQDRAEKGRMAQADILKKLNHKKENKHRVNSVPDNSARSLQLSDVYEELLTPMIVVNGDGRIESINRQARAWFSLYDRDVLGESVHALFRAQLGEAYDIDDTASLPLFKSFSGPACVIDLGVSRLSFSDESEGKLLFQWQDNTAIESVKKEEKSQAAALVALSETIDQQRLDLAKLSNVPPLPANDVEIDRLVLLHKKEQQKQHDLTLDLVRVVFKKVEDEGFDVSLIDAAAHSSVLSELIGESNHFISRLNNHTAPIKQLLSQADSAEVEPQSTFWQQTESALTQLFDLLHRRDQAYYRSESVIEKVTRLLTQFMEDSVSTNEDRTAIVMRLQSALSGNDQGLPALDDTMDSLGQSVTGLGGYCDDMSSLLTAGQESEVQTKAMSESMGEIVNVVNALAFQTNMLALNAAVEAARAGEEGRGFAIIASEVKRVSKSSASIAKEIKSILSENDGYLERRSELFVNVGLSVAQMKPVLADIGDGLVRSKDGFKTLSSDLTALRRYVDDTHTVKGGDTELEQKLDKLVLRLQRYMNDV